MIAPAILFMLAFQADTSLDQRVTFTCPAETVSMAVDQLAKRSGVSLETETPVSNEMIVLRFKNVPLRDAMDKIATAATGEWVRGNSGYRLERSMELVHAVQHKEKLDRLKAIRDAIKDRIKNLAPFDLQAYKNAFEERRAQNKKRGNDGGDNRSTEPPKTQIEEPGERLITRILGDMDVNAIAELPSQQRVVFSTSPTAMQRPLSGDLSATMDNFMIEQNSWSKAEREAMEQSGRDGQIQDVTTETWLIRNGATAGTTGGSGQIMIDGPGESFPLDQGQVKGPVGKVLVIMTADWDSETIDIRFKICDTKGRVISSPEGNLTLSRPSDSTPDAPDDDSSTAAKPPAKKIELSPLAFELQTFLARQTQSSDSYFSDSEEPRPTSPAKPISPELRQFLLHPEENEILALWPSEPLLKAAEAKDYNVAVCIDDTVLSSTLALASNADQITDLMVAGIGHAALQKGWMVGTPNHPLQTQHEGRPFLGKFLRSCSVQGRVGLDTLGAYAQKIPDFSSSLGCIAVNLLFPDQSNQAQQSDWLFLRLFGSLNETQRALLAKGAKLSVLNLDTGQQNTIAAIIYRQEVNQNQPEMTQENMQDIQRQMMDVANSLISEPTELLPNGLDRIITLSISQNKEQVVFTSMEYGGYELPPQAMDVDTLVSMSMGIWNEGGAPTKITGYHLGERETYNMVIGLPASCSQEGDLIDAKMQSGPRLSLDKLPPDLKKQIDDRTAEFKKYFDQTQTAGFSRHRGDGQNSVPPPRK